MVGEKHLIYQYIFITLVKRSQNALQIKTKSLFCILYQECSSSPGSDLIFRGSFAAVEFALFYAEMLCICGEKKKILRQLFCILLI